MVRKGVAFFRCRLDESTSVRVDVPQWMFDPAICSTLRVHCSPNVSVVALRSLMSLLREISGIADQSSPNELPERKHFHTDNGDATHACVEFEQATESIRAETGTTSLEQPAGGSKRRSSQRPGAADA